VKDESQMDGAYQQVLNYCDSLVQATKAAAPENPEETPSKEVPKETTIPLSVLISYFSSKVSGSTKKQLALLQKFKRRNNVDILLTHDWPEGLIPNDIKLRGSRPMGNRVCRGLTECLQPKLDCCGHMHTSFRAQVKHTGPGTGGEPATAGEEVTTSAHCSREEVTTSTHGNGVTTTPASSDVTQVCCVNKVSYPHAVAVYRYDVQTASMREIDPPPENEVLACLQKAAEEEPSDVDE